MRIRMFPPKAYQVKPVYDSTRRPLRLRGVDAPDRPNRCAECGAALIGEPCPAHGGPVCSECWQFVRWEVF